MILPHFFLLIGSGLASFLIEFPGVSLSVTWSPLAASNLRQASFSLVVSSPAVGSSIRGAEIWPVSSLCIPFLHFLFQPSGRFLPHPSPGDGPASLIFHPACFLPLSDHLFYHLVRSGGQLSTPLHLPDILCQDLPPHLSVQPPGTGQIIAKKCICLPNHLLLHILLL